MHTNGYVLFLKHDCGLFVSVSTALKGSEEGRRGRESVMMRGVEGEKLLPRGGVLGWWWFGGGVLFGGELSTTPHNIPADLLQ